MATKRKPITKKKEIKKEKELSPKQKELMIKIVARGMKHHNAGKRKRQPSVVYVKPNLAIVPLYNAPYNPDYVAYVDEYLDMCYESFAKREAYRNAPTPDEYGKDKSGKFVVVRQGVKREELEDKDRYVPLVHLPNLAGLCMFLRFEKRVAITKDTVMAYCEIDPNWKARIDMLLNSNEAFCIKMGANSIGHQNITMIQLQNNHKYMTKDENVVTTINIWNQIYQHITSNVPKEYQAPEGKDTDILLMREKQAKGEVYGE